MNFKKKMAIVHHFLKFDKGISFLKVQESPIYYFRRLFTHLTQATQLQKEFGVQFGMDKSI